MTQNQIAFQNYQETKRHNLATEGETQRHNFEDEKIRVFSNTTTAEHYQRADAANLQQAQAATVQAEVAQRNAEINAANAATRAYEAAISAQNARTRERELQNAIENRLLQERNVALQEQLVPVQAQYYSKQGELLGVQTQQARQNLAKDVVGSVLAGKAVDVGALGLPTPQTTLGGKINEETIKSVQQRQQERQQNTSAAQRASQALQSAIRGSSRKGNTALTFFLQ